MTILSTLGRTSGAKVRYAVVALDNNAPASMLPGIAHTGNSEVTASARWIMRRR